MSEMNFHSPLIIANIWIGITFVLTANGNTFMAIVSLILAILWIITAIKHIGDIE